MTAAGKARPASLGYRAAGLLLGMACLLAFATPAPAQDATPAAPAAAEALQGAGETTAPPQTSAPAADPARGVPPPAGQAAPASPAPQGPVPGMAPPEEPATPPAPAGLVEEAAAAASRLLGPSSPDPRLPHDLSPWGMFMAADWVVKGVMIGLAFASLATWTIWLAKTIEIACARARARRALRVIAHAPTLQEAADSLSRRGGPAAFMVRTADGEMGRSEAVLDHAGNAGVSGRVQSHLVRIESQAGRRLARGTGVLATIGSTAPFVGLFGTVWGIMNAFIGISEAQSTNLAIVAPGIAEALLATAIGLVAAIPAVVFYNVFARSIAGYKQVLADASAAVERLVSLDLDRRKVPPRTMRPAAE